MTQIHARLYDAKSRQRLHEEVMALLAAVPPAGATIAHHGAHYVVNGVEYALDGALLVFVVARPAPNHAIRVVAEDGWMERSTGVASGGVGGSGTPLQGWMVSTLVGGGGVGGVVGGGLAPVCTGIAAVWCPIHGDCSCARDPDTGERIVDSEHCALHGPSSMHGDAEERARQERAEREQREREVARAVERILRFELERGNQPKCQRCGVKWQAGKQATCMTQGSEATGFEHDWAMEVVRDAGST